MVSLLCCSCRSNILTRWAALSGYVYRFACAAFEIFTHSSQIHKYGLMGIHCTTASNCKRSTRWCKYLFFLQVAYICRNITTAEYDEAILREPASCPLFIMGDMRSGRQVLHAMLPTLPLSTPPDNTQLHNIWHKLKAGSFAAVCFE